MMEEVLQTPQMTRTSAPIGACSEKDQGTPSSSPVAESSARALAGSTLPSTAVLNLINETLLNDLRRLKAELMEKELRIEQLETAHNALARRAERQDRLNEENWDLEIRREDLEGRLRQAEKANKRLIQTNERQQKELHALVAVTEEREMETLERCERLKRQIHALENEKRQLQLEPLSSSPAPAPSRTLPLSPTPSASPSPTADRERLSTSLFRKKKAPAPPLSSLVDENTQLLRTVTDLRVAMEKERAEKAELQQLLAESQDRVEQQQHELSCSSIIVCQTPELSTLPVDMSTQCDNGTFLSHTRLPSPALQHPPSPPLVHQQARLASIDSEESELGEENERVKAINAVTQSMIGDWMTKTTGKYVVNKTGVSQYKRHRRYCWIHPYTRTLYWSATQPDVDHHESKAKQAFIQDVGSIPVGPQALGLLIRTPARNIHLVAPTMDIHDRWLMALCFLVSGGLLQRRQPKYTFAIGGEGRLGRSNSVPHKHDRSQSS